MGRVLQGEGDEMRTTRRDPFAAAKALESNLADVRVTEVDGDGDAYGNFNSIRAYSARWISTGVALSESELDELNSKHLNFVHSSYLIQLLGGKE